jgi:hypothetical protein
VFEVGIRIDVFNLLLNTIKSGGLFRSRDGLG